MDAQSRISIPADICKFAIKLDRMRPMKSYEECKTCMDQHREQMAARAAESGRKALEQPKRDACATLKP